MDQSYVTGSSLSYLGPAESPEDTPILNTLRYILLKGAPELLKISMVSVPFQIRDDSLIYHYSEGLSRVAQAN